MSADERVAESVAAMLGRLRVVAPLLDPTWIPDSELTVGPLLSRIADAVADDATDARVWLLATAVAGGYPTSSEVVGVRRGLQLALPGLRGGAVLAGVALTAVQVRSASVSLELVDSVVVDVDFCATYAHNTGIQRVVRNTVPHWSAPHVLSAWSADGTGYRRLTDEQRELVVNWRSGMPPTHKPTDAGPLLVPVGGSVLLPEVPAHGYIERLAAVAHFSGNDVGLIGYDAIPLVSADSMDDAESDRFAHYLEIVKRSTTISCISATTADEFAAIGHSFAAQGLNGPVVRTLSLPEARPTGLVATDRTRQRERPLVLMVGSLEPRKNQLGVLAAADILWARGLDFELQFIGGGSAWFLAIMEREVAARRRQGYPVTVRTGASDTDLAAAYDAATVFAFPSLQEGYGLPIVEALATGTPVVTTNYGSMAEIALGGGCVTVDARDDDSIADGIAALLEDPLLRERLIAEALARPSGTWSDYARELWNQLVGRDE